MHRLRHDFPIFSHHPNLVYLDSAATTQKPQAVLDAMVGFLSTENAPIYRATYPLAEQATQHLEQARETIAGFFSATPEQLIVTASATAATNLLAQGLAHLLNPEDTVVVSKDAHHSQLLPWEAVAPKIEYLPFAMSGAYDLSQLPANAKLVCLSHCSNVLGYVQDITSIREKAPAAFIIIDCCQTAAHTPISLATLGADAVIMAGHKLYAPTGTGLIIASERLLSALQPSQFGGGMVQGVTTEKVVLQQGSRLFEAGSPATESIIGLAAALTYLQTINWDTSSELPDQLHEYAREQLATVPGLHILGDPSPASGLVSFYHPIIHAHDLAALLGEGEICLRAGQHCAGLLHEYLSIPASLRLSLGVYSSRDDIDTCVAALHHAIKRLS